MLLKLSEVQNLVLCDDWVMQTNGLSFEKQNHYHVLKNGTQRGTTDCLVFPTLNG